MRRRDRGAEGNGRGQEMRHSLCRSCFASSLKLLHFLQTFVGVSVLIYSIWVFDRWRRLDLQDLPVPWFACAVMGSGITLCLIAFTGYAAAEAVNACCLCFYTVLTTMLIVLEAALVGDLLLNKRWEEDLPYDSTGELKNLRAFVEDNMDIFEWAAASVIAIQALSILLTLVLRAMVPPKRVAYDGDEDFIVTRRPLLSPQGGGLSYATTSVDNKGFHSDDWSSRMRQKYGLNQGEFSHNAVDPKTSMPVK